MFRTIQANVMAIDVSGILLGAEQETSCYLKQWWRTLLTHICVIEELDLQGPILLTQFNFNLSMDK